MFSNWVNCYIFTQSISYTKRRIKTNEFLKVSGIMIGKFIGLVIILTFLTPQFGSSTEKTKKKTVVIDAGHGGKDTGAVGNKSKEKDLVLSISLLVGKYLESNLPNVDVIYTRKDDTFIPLRERANIANKNNADLFVSIHVNSNKSNKPYGTETYRMGAHKTQGNLEVAQKENAVIVYEEDYQLDYEGFDPNSTESYIMFSMMQNIHLFKSLSMASYIEDEFKTKAKRKSRGVKQAGFLVLWLTSMPSVLVECGFLSNAKEETYLLSTQNQEFLASAIYRAIKKYIIELEKEEQDLNKLSVYETTSTEDVKEIIAPTTPSKEKSKSNSSFRVQATSSSSQLGINHPIFSKYSVVYEYKEGNMFKYSIGSYVDYEEAKKEQPNIKKDFPGAFIIAFKGNNKITIKEALKENQ